MDWKWWIATGVGLLGIVAPIIWTEYSEIKERNLQLEDAAGTAFELHRKIDRTMKIATGAVAMVPPFGDQTALDVAIRGIRKRVEEVSAQTAPSELFRRQMRRTSSLLGYYVEDLSYCDSLDATAAIPLRHIATELLWISATLREEKSLLPRLLASPPDQEDYVAIATRVGLEFHDPDQIGLGLNACCQKHLSSLSDQNLGTTLLTPGMCEVVF